MAIYCLSGNRYRVQTMPKWRTLDESQLAGLYGMSLIYDGRGMPAFTRIDCDRSQIMDFRASYEAIFGQSAPVYQVRTYHQGAGDLTINNEYLYPNPLLGDDHITELYDKGYIRFGSFGTIPPEHAHDVIAALWRASPETSPQKI